MFCQYLRQAGWVGWRARDGIDAQLADRLDQKRRVASAKRHHQRAGRFQPQVVGQPAHPQLVIEAVDDDVARSQAGRRLRPPGHLGLQFCIMGR